MISVFEKACAEAKKSSVPQGEGRFPQNQGAHEEVDVGQSDEQLSQTWSRFVAADENAKKTAEIYKQVALIIGGPNKDRKWPTPFKFMQDIASREAIFEMVAQEDY